MKTFSRRACCVLFLLIVSTGLFSQRVENVSFRLQDTIIVIYYDLSSSERNRVYNFCIECENSRGQKFPVSSLSGDFYRVSPGKGKEIRWNVLKDTIQLNDSISFNIVPCGSHPKREGNGPAWAMTSLILPGSGSLIVKGPHNKNPELSIALFCVYAVSCGFTAENYIQYQEGKTDRSYRSAALFWSLIASSCIIGDTANAFKIGVGNRRKNRANSIGFSASDFRIVPSPAGMGIGLIKRF